MSPRRKPSGMGLALGAVALAAVAAFTFAIVRSQRLPEGPVPIVWDKEACAHCRMHIGEPPFAAQLQLQDGQVLNYDDPGCLFQWLHAHPAAAPHALYFHHLREDRWLSSDQAGFVEVSPTPMGFGLGAVERGAPGAVGLEEAKAKVARGREERG